MNLHQLNDHQLLALTKDIVNKEREVLTKVLQHLREIDRRKLYCDQGYGSLFEYAVKELKYSEGQATRRIQAMRLIKDIPQIEKSIASGELSLTNASQAQTVFYSMARKTPHTSIQKKEKLEIVNSLKNKSSREGQKELIKLQPNIQKPHEKERVISEDATEVRFVMNEKLKQKLEQVRCLLGSKGACMSYGELFDEMAEISLNSLEIKKFGKKRVKSEKKQKTSTTKSTPAPARAKPSPSCLSKNSRYLSNATKHFVWRRDEGKCTNCGSRKHLNIDHIKPIASGGGSNPDNLRLLCFNCNQREAMRAFGVLKMESFYPQVTF